MKKTFNPLKNSNFVTFIKRSLNFLRLKLCKPKDIFTRIYKTNGWKDSESASGTGSNIAETRKIVENLPRIFEKYSIRSILDLPCGDYNWMNQLDFKEIKYTGGDIVGDIVDNNQKKFGSKNIVFEEFNLVDDNLPQNDLVFVRDCLVHLSFKDIRKSLLNIIESNSKYLITTSFTKRDKNKNIATGEWRTVNFQLHPFNFPSPLEIINEDCNESLGQYSDKSLCMWKISDLKNLI